MLARRMAKRASDVATLAQSIRPCHFETSKPGVTHMCNPPCTSVRYTAPATSSAAALARRRGVSRAGSRADETGQVDEELGDQDLAHGGSGVGWLDSPGGRRQIEIGQGVGTPAPAVLA